MATDGGSCPQTRSQLKWSPRFRCTGDRFASHASRRKNRLSLSSESPSSPPQRRSHPSPLRNCLSTMQLCLQIADDLIFLAFSTCLVCICSARQETKKSQRVSPVSTKLSRATNKTHSPMPRDHSLSIEERRANSFLLARTQKHQRCELSDTGQPLPDLCGRWLHYPPGISRFSRRLKASCKHTTCQEVQYPN